MRYRCLLQALILAFMLVLSGFAGAARAAPKLDPELTARLSTAPSSRQLGVILTFHGPQITDSQVVAVRALGITMGVRMANFPIMAVNATPGQIQQMMNWNSLRSIYLNVPLELNLDQTKPLIGVTRLRTDNALTARNGGLPVSGRGITIAINDTGIDGAHPDVTFNPLNPSAGKTIQNVLVNPNDKDGLVVRTNSSGNVLEGILPATYVDNVINTDTHVGHGTHCAGIAAGTGQASGARYQGVAPGAKLVGLGSGGVLFVLGQVAAFDYIYTNQFFLNIRVVNNSWGNSAVAVDPDHPVNVASKQLHDERNIVVVFANGNDGPRPNTQNRWASVPWVIMAGAATKDGRLAGFSSRGIFGDPIIHPTLLTPGTGGPADQGFTSDVVAARALTNTVANGADADEQIPVAFLPYYTQISGTSMAAPHLAGVVACILEANPSLSADDVKTILEQTATPLSTYDQFEVGAGLANVHAAVDLAFDPHKHYGNFGFNAKGLTLLRENGGDFAAILPARGTADHTFILPSDMRFAFVQLDWEGSIGEDELVVDNTRIVLNDLTLTIYRDGQQVAVSNKGNLPALYGAREAVKLEFPAAGTYTARISAGLSGAGAAFDQPYRLSITNYVYDSNEAADIAGLDAAARKNVYRLVYDRIMSAEGGAFRPADPLTRMELGRALMFGARVPQFLSSQPSFTDLAQGSPNQLVAESLKREGVMGLDSGATFGPSVPVTRLEQAVALVRALRMDTQARALANTAVTFGGQPLTDNAQIPGAFRGYVQISLDKGLMEAFPAEVREIAPGQFMAIPGPRFEPSRIVKRSEFTNPMVKLLNLMFGE